MSDRKVASPGGSEGAHRATGEAPGLVNVAAFVQAHDEVMRRPSSDASCECDL
jgi:hypothetical protein